MKRLRCPCGNILFFDSSRCFKCGSEVGYDPQRGVMRDLTDTKRCANAIQPSACNWLLPAGSSEQLCAACRLNRTIPDLGSERNRMLWGRMESAKRRLLYTLLNLNVTLPSLAEDTANGLAFDVVGGADGPAITTGHLRGVITLNLEAADDTWRAMHCQAPGESRRTLLGHLRYESGHYLWHRCLSRVDLTHPLRQAFRELFGDEPEDYDVAMGRHYQRGPSAGPDRQFITDYAARHPREDWAETWAHFLQIVDAFETCENLGIRGGGVDLPLTILPIEACALPCCLTTSTVEDRDFLSWIQRWICLSAVLNEISRSFGTDALYPFVISVPIARKLRFAHYLAALWKSGFRSPAL